MIKMERSSFWKKLYQGQGNSKGVQRRNSIPTAQSSPAALNVTEKTVKR
jgi:hypothetical protein